MPSTTFLSGMTSTILGLKSHTYSSAVKTTRANGSTSSFFSRSSWVKITTTTRILASNDMGTRLANAKRVFLFYKFDLKQFPLRTPLRESFGVAKPTAHLYFVTLLYLISYAPYPREN